MSEKLMRALGYVVAKHNAKVQQLALTVGRSTTHLPRQSGGRRLARTSTMGDIC